LVNSTFAKNGDHRTLVPFQNNILKY
jgi:hypothetical protein